MNKLLNNLHKAYDWEFFSYLLFLDICFTACASNHTDPVNPEGDPVFTKMPASYTEEIEQAGELRIESYSVVIEDGRTIQKESTGWETQDYGPGKGGW